MSLATVGSALLVDPFCLRRNWPKQCATIRKMQRLCLVGKMACGREEICFVQSNSDTRGIVVSKSLSM